MKKLNNKGFTLVELLTVILILLVILAVAMPSITSAVKRTQNKQTSAEQDSEATNIALALQRGDFNNSNASKGYNAFKDGKCYVRVDTVHNKNIPGLPAKGNVGNGFINYDKDKNIQYYANVNDVKAKTNNIGGVACSLK